MAALSTGAQVLASTGPLYDQHFADGLAGLAHSEAEFVTLAASAWKMSKAVESRASRLTWYQEHMAAARLDEHLLALVAP